MNLLKLVAKVLKGEEGFSPTPYLCSEGYVTIGFGTKLHNALNQHPASFPITVSKTQALEWLQRDVKNIERKLMQSSVGGYGGIYDSLSKTRKAIIISMCYQMGVKGVLRFNGMWAALTLDKFEIAANEMLDSRWAHQTERRANRHATAMATDSFGGYYG